MEREGQIILEGSCLAVGADGSGSYGTGGALAATFGYDSYGLPSSTVTGSVQHYSYSFDPVKGNLLSRKNEKNGMQEGFSYDSLDRLTWVSRGSSPFHNTVYDDNGNITSKSDAGTLIFLGYVVLYWISVQRPPMRTMGETRLWFSLFISVIGYITFKVWRYQYIYAFYLLLAIVFTFINILKPEIHSKALMPALQSYWFIPHVTAYILSYAMLGAATIMAIIILVKKEIDNERLLLSMDKMVYIGFGLIILGMLMGAVWAKDAWGHYWSWDPKETWAFITVCAYLIYIHLRLQPNRVQLSAWMLILAFVLLMVTWKGVNYLPSAQNSIHIYSKQ